MSLLRGRLIDRYGRDERVRGIEAGWLFDADLSPDRLHRLVEAGHHLLGLEDVEDEEAVLGIEGSTDASPRLVRGRRWLRRRRGERRLASSPVTAPVTA